MRRYLLPLIFVLALIVLSLGSYAHWASAEENPLLTTVAVPDFYVVDSSTCLPTFLNDIESPGEPWIYDQAQHSTASHPPFDYCGTEAELGYNQVYTGFDFFTYRYRTYIGSGPSDPDQWSNIAPVFLLLIGNGDQQNAGSCRKKPVPDSVANPVNVTNGNMWLEHRDYVLPGLGERIEIDRFYNSMIQTAGLFGTGWSTKYDESLTIYPDDKLVRFNDSESLASYFGRPNTGDPFKSFSPGADAQIVKNGNGTYTLTHKDGSVRDFNSSGKLTSQKDTNGNQTTLTYNISGYLISITDPTNRTVNFTPNTNGTIAQVNDMLGLVANYEYYPSSTLLKTVTFPDGSKYKFEYDTTTVSGKALLTTVKDALDNILETHVYDSQGRATTSEKHGGVDNVTIAYDQWDSIYGNYTKVTDANDHVTKYFWFRRYGTNLISRVEGSCNCGGGGSEVTRYEYDTSNSWLNLKKKTDALDRETTYTYDGNRNLTAVTDIYGTQTFTHNSLGKVLTATGRMNGVTANTYHGSGNLETSTNPLGQTTTFTYTPQGQLETIEDAREKVTTLIYHPTSKLLWKIKDANNKFTTFTYDSRARVETVTNALTETTTFEYDDNNRIEKIIHPDTNFVFNKYDLAGRLEWRENELGHRTTFGYDNAYRLTSVTDPLLHVKSYEYDLMSNLKKYTDGEGNETVMDYDDFDRLEKITYPLPAMGETQLNEQYTYDAIGRLKTHKDTASRTTTYNYDDVNRRITITDPMTQVTKLDFNPRFQMIKVIDAALQQYDFTYDPFGRMLTSTRAGTTMTMEYNEVGNRKKRIDYNGNVTDYAYDDLNRLTDVTYTGASGENATYGYDDLHRLTTATNQNGTVTFTYDNRGRLKTETDVHGQVMESIYDAASRREALKLNSNVHMSYDYDDADRLETLKDEVNATWTYQYDDADKLTSQAAPNGVTTTYEYDGMSRLRRLKHKFGAVSVYDFQYGFNAANQISQITDLAGTKTYGYDNINRLTGVTGAATESYAYDSVGNRLSSYLSSTYVTDPFNILAATDDTIYTYDSNGSMTGKTSGGDSWIYGWDRENRMVSANLDVKTATYDYDALGRRVKRTDGSTVAKYTHDGQDVVRDEDNGAARTYQNDPGIDNKLKYNASNGARYFMQDHLGSTVGTANVSGIRRDAVSYDSYGNPSDTTYRYRYQFTGREYDSFTGMYYYRARFYDSQTGRFVSEDPIGFAGKDINLYGYVWNNPVKFVDPSGTDGTLVLRLAAGAGAGVGIAAGLTAFTVAAVGVGAIYGANELGHYTAAHPSNPFVNGPWPVNPYKPPFGYPAIPPLPTTLSPTNI